MMTRLHVQSGTSLLNSTGHIHGAYTIMYSGNPPPVQSPEKEDETIFSLPAKDVEWVHTIHDENVKREVVKNISDYIKQCRSR